MSPDEGRDASRLAEETLAERWQRLDRETLAEAKAAVAGGRRFHRLDVARAPLAFLRALLVGCSILKGTRGLIEAGLHGVHTFVLHLRIWSLHHDAERGGEPHEDRPC